MSQITFQQRLNAAKRRVATRHITGAANGLDLADADDRAIFRQRLDESYRMTKLSYMREQAFAMGYSVSGGASRQRVVRAIADGWISGPKS